MKLLLFFLVSSTICLSQNFFKSPFANTYSIVARDTVTGEMGVAVQSNWYSVGTIVSWGEAGVGVVATQSFVNPSFGPRGLALLKQGLTANQVLKYLIESDDASDVRQLSILDANGNVATHTGINCIKAAGHFIGDNYSVQANLVENDSVWIKMAEKFESSSGPLEERLMQTLEAAELAGGDIRGKQSAAILVVKKTSSGNVWYDRKVDIRVDDHREPLKELRRILKVHKAYEHMNKGDLAIEHDDMELAMKEYAAAENMFPDNEEMKFWKAVTLANVNRVEDALPIFKDLYSKNKKWVELTKRLIEPNLLLVDKLTLQKILDQAN